LSWFARFKHFGGDAVSLNDHVKAFAILVAFSNDIVASFEPRFFESISQFSSFVLLHTLKNFNFFQKVIIFFSFDLDCSFNDMVESVSIKRPQVASG
jgi:hypothetical protein